MPFDLARFIRPGDGIILGQACAEPQSLSEALAAQRAAFSGASLFLGVNYAGILRPEHADHLKLAAMARHHAFPIIASTLSGSRCSALSNRSFACAVCVFDRRS